jgi:uncharacterized repeat protein (TIGR01451 family)
VVPSVTLTMGVPNMPWTNAAIGAAPGTAPGQCIAYLIVGTNTTANNINNITLSDVVPTNTRFNYSLTLMPGDSCTPLPPNITTGPLFASVVPANNMSGTITAVSAASNVGPAAPATVLLPGGVVTMQFCVRINAS